MSEDRGAVGRLMGAIVPRAVDAVDVGEVIERVDVDAIIDRVDVDAIVARVDVDAIVARVDIDAILARVDMDALMARLDLNAVLDRLDLDDVLERIDMNRLIGRVDLDRVLDGVDVRALVAKAGIDDIVAEATTGMAARTLDLARRQVLGVDLILTGGVDRALRRPRPEIDPEHDPDVRLSASGRPAGPVARGLAFAADWAMVSVLFGLGVTLASSLFNLFAGEAVITFEDGGLSWALGYLAWWFVYLWASLVIAGRTFGKALVGLRVVAVDGQPLSGRRAALRVVVLPVGFVGGIAFVPGVVRRDRRALHDLAAGSQEIIDWGGRAAGIPSALDRWVRQHPTPTPT
ncbi:MAG: RDD family protein [Acidimicrobiales bacterium]|nr:RDD family protein [Acidimicrobiales bacterium]